MNKDNMEQEYVNVPTYIEKSVKKLFKLKELQSRTSRPMKYNKYTVFDLEERFSGDDKNGCS